MFLVTNSNNHGLIIRGLYTLIKSYPRRTVFVCFVFFRDEAWENSPDNYLGRIYSNCGKAKVMVAVGGKESPEFIRQSKSFSKVSYPCSFIFKRGAFYMFMLA